MTYHTSCSKPKSSLAHPATAVLDWITQHNIQICTVYNIILCTIFIFNATYTIYIVDNIQYTLQYTVSNIYIYIYIYIVQNA